MNSGKILYVYYIFLLLLFFLDNYKNDYVVYDICNSDVECHQDINLYDGMDSNQKIDINTASKDILSKYLCGIGNSKAQAIIDYRERMGGFYNIDEILNVKGIGDNIFSQIKEKICIKTIKSFH